MTPRKILLGGDQGQDGLGLPQEVALVSRCDLDLPGGQGARSDCFGSSARAQQKVLEANSGAGTEMLK